LGKGRKGTHTVPRASQGKWPGIKAQVSDGGGGGAAPFDATEFKDTFKEAEVDFANPVSFLRGFNLMNVDVFYNPWPGVPARS
jgi:hypothetical protein